MRAVHNVHERVIDSPAAIVGALLDRLGGDHDVLWPAPAWVPMRLDRPLEVGATGGHGAVRYEVVAYEPGRRVRFRFHPRLGLDGHHEAVVEPVRPDRCRLRHVVAATPRGRMRVLWPVVVRPLHDAVIEDLLDNAEAIATGRLARPATWSWWVRAMRVFEFPRPRAVPVPDRARLARSALDRVDFVDAWQVALPPGATTDPQVWAERVFRSPPPWVVGLLRLRNALVGLLGIERGDRSAFDLIEVAGADDGPGGEALLGTDAGHLDFRASVLVDVSARTVTLTTITRISNRRGQAYMGVVRHLHPLVVRAMLRRATRQVATEGRPPVGVPGTSVSRPAPDDHQAPAPPAQSSNT